MSAESQADRRVPLAVLDLVPIAEGSNAGEALRRSIDLARRAESFGYARYWLAEHHLNPGVAGAAPHTFLGILAASTDRIRVGTAATILGNYEPLQVAEAFGTVAALWPGRVDLGLGRSGLPPAKADAAGESAPAAPAAPDADPAPAAPDADPAPPAANEVIDGLVVPPQRPFRFDRARFGLQARLLGRTVGDAGRFADDVDALRDFFAGPVRYADDSRPGGVTVDAQPATGNPVELWVHGSSAGESARLAGRLGLRFGANYHVAPSGVLAAVAEYREHFRPSTELERPHTIVSVDVVVAPTDAEARRLASGYAEWVLSIREGQGAVPYPSPEQATPDAELSSAALDAVQDRLDTRFVGSPASVVAQLETLQRATGADELLVTTITHDHEARVASYRLLAEAWHAASPAVGEDRVAERAGSELAGAAVGA
ncbi:LLM class flavin-dependent oxidoreductase [Agromyces sp. Marseille-Q5079]|uniref:LLM class flavin-dependent oxidoreductase n=1 Tax=Agromyces sp. Marseille-Q5079 TaxID=3439059 RepID=UPI003D9C7D10